MQSSEEVRQVFCCRKHKRASGSRRKHVMQVTTVSTNSSNTVNMISAKKLMMIRQDAIVSWKNIIASPIGLDFKVLNAQIPAAKAEKASSMPFVEFKAGIDFYCHCCLYKPRVKQDAWLINLNKRNTTQKHNPTTCSSDTFHAIMFSYITKHSKQCQFLPSHTHTPELVPFLIW